MLVNIERGSVPLGGHAASLGVLPELCNNLDVPVTYKDGTKGICCHIAANGAKFPLAVVMGGQLLFNSITFKQISYMGPDGDVLTHDIKKPLAVNFTHTTKFTLGFVTKLNGLRWGFNFEYSTTTGIASFINDRDSPIIGVCFHLENT